MSIPDTQILLKQSKILNIGNSCAFDSLTIWLNLIPTDYAVKIINYFDNDFKYLFVKLTEQLYMKTTAELKNRLTIINREVKKHFNTHQNDFLSIDDMLFENEKLVESNLLIPKDVKTKKISVEIVHVNNCHYVVKITFDNNIIYIDDLLYLNHHSRKYWSEEKPVLSYNFEKNEDIDNLFDKINNICD